MIEAYVNELKNRVFHKDKDELNDAKSVCTLSKKTKTLKWKLTFSSKE
jgi:hypothetical protein